MTAHRSPPTWQLNQRDEMILQHLPLVRYVVGKLHIDTSGAAADFEDLVGFGTTGLIQAVDRFNDAQAVPFSAFAIARIRGAVLDAVRRLDHLSRGQRSKATAITVSQNELSLSLGRVPSEEEVREATGMTREEFTAARVVASFSSVPINQDYADAGSNGYPEPAFREQLPSAAVEREELLHILAAAVESLPERERLVVGLYYEQDLTHREIANILDISASRVSQLIHQALARLRRNRSLENVALPLAA
jgi:RNA polymerase sigma factor FliA